MNEFDANDLGEAAVEACQRDGSVCLRGAFSAAEVELLRVASIEVAECRA